MGALLTARDVFIEKMMGTYSIPRLRDLVLGIKRHGINLRRRDHMQKIV